MRWDSDDESMDESIETNDDNREGEAFVTMTNLTKADIEEEWAKKVEKYEKDGKTEEEAKEKANEKLAEKDARQCMDQYITIIKYMLQLQNGSVHRAVMHDVMRLIEDGYEEDKAIRMAVKKHKHILDEMWEGGTDDETDESDGNDEDI